MTFTIYNEGLLERIFDVPRCGFWYNTYQQIGSFSGTEDIIYKNVKFRQNMSGFGSTLQRYTYRVLQTIQMKLILFCVWAEPAALGSAKTALKFIYKI